MASPFAVFRRNQKVMTVILTCLAMFAFIILDSVSKMESSAIIPIIFGLIGATLAWALGSHYGFPTLAWSWDSQNEQRKTYRYPTFVVGAGVGAIIGAIVVSQSGNQGGLATAHGRLTNRDLLEMKQKRDMANQFVISAFRERKGEVHPMMANYYLNQYRFGDTSSRSVVTKMLLEKEADGLGIEISDEFITNYIKTVSENSMTREALTKIRSQLGMGESELYDTLRSELRARVASRVLNPELVHMPDQYWGDFEKLNVRHSIDAVAIPVEPFAARLPRPSDAEINEIFEAFKGVYPMGENPGFIQPDRLRLAWFESDYEAAEKLVGEIPEDELKARYEERKEIEYKIETLPDLDSGFDDGGLKFGEPPAPVKTSKPAGDGEATDDAAKLDDSKADPAAKTDDAAPADSSATEEAKPSDAAPSDDAAAKTESSDGDSKSEEECGDGDDQESEQPKDDALKNDAPKDETADAKPEETPAAESKSEDESKPASESKAEGDAPEVPADATKEGTEEAAAADPAEVKYRSFEEVRDEIRDLMLREKTEERIAVAIAAVKDWRFKLREENPDLSDEDLAAGISAKAETYAVENGLKFVSIADFLSQQELIEHSEYKIGTAREPFDPSNFMAQSQPQTVAARLFSGATTLFVPEEAQGQFDETRYAFWATGEKEQHVPTLDEPGVREQVEAAVRLKNARPLAEARAKAVAESLAAKFAESSIVTMAEGIADQSVFGPKKSEAADVAVPDAEKSKPESTEAESSDESQKEEPCGDEDVTAEETPADSGAGKPEIVSDKKNDESTDQPLSVISTPPFTWLRQSSQGMQMNPFGQPSIEFGFIPGIDDVDDNFMKTVSETPVGEVVVIPNATKQIYYVVYVKARNPSGDDDPGLAPVRQQFITENAPMSPIYSRLAESQGGSVNQAWQIQFFAKHNVSIEELDAI